MMLAGSLVFDRLLNKSMIAPIIQPSKKIVKVITKTTMVSAFTVVLV